MIVDFLTTNRCLFFSYYSRIRPRNAAVAALAHIKAMLAGDALSTSLPTRDRIALSSFSESGWHGSGLLAGARSACDFALSWRWPFGPCCLFLFIPPSSPVLSTFFWIGTAKTPSLRFGC